MNTTSTSRELETSSPSLMCQITSIRHTTSIWLLLEQKTTPSTSTSLSKSLKHKYRRFNETSGLATEPLLTLNYYPNDKTKLREQYPISNNSFGPFSDLPKDKLKEMMMLVESFDIEYLIRSTLPTASAAESDCYDWQIIQDFDFSLRS